MALVIRDGKVVYIMPPRKLTPKEINMLEDAPINQELIKRATSRKYNIV